MRIDLGLVLGIVLEYIFFIYHADTLFYRKRNKYICYLIIAVNYFIHLVICVFGNIIVNTIVFTAINILSFLLCYHISIKNAVLQSVILVILCAVGELLIILAPYFKIVPTNTVMMSEKQSMILTLVSKSFYLIGIILVNKMFCKDDKNYGVPSIVMISVPVITIVIYVLIFTVNVTSNLLLLACILLILINAILLLINKKMTDKDLEITNLKSETIRDNMVLEKYLLIKDKYDKMHILHHDFKEHINALNSLIEKDNVKAREYMKSIYDEEKASEFIEYSDNDMLNILLSKKKKECLNKNIEFVIEPIQAHLSFFNDMDTVTLFSNIINNAIEACEYSINKIINFDIHTINDNFVVIRVENTSDTQPIVIDGKLRTHKDNERLHGIGMTSIRNALKKYDGSLDWSYDINKKIFTTTIIIQNKLSNYTTQAV